MIIYLYGPDSYRRNAKLRELVAAYRSKYSATDLAEFDLTDREEAWKEVKEYLGQPSMFVESKVAVVAGGGRVAEKGWIELLKAHLKTPKTFIIVTDTAAPRKALGFLLKKPVTSHEYEMLSGATLDAFIRKEAERAGVLLAPDARRALLRIAERTKEDASWVVVQGLAKLSLADLPTPVKGEELKRFFEEREHEEVYRVARSILAARDPSAKLTSLEHLFLQNEAPAYIFNSLSFQSRGEDAVALAEYDVLVKSGKLEYDEALLDFAIS